MLNTLFGRNWNICMPDVESVESRVVTVSDNGTICTIESGVIEILKRNLLGVEIEDLFIIEILKQTVIKGNIIYLGNCDFSDGSFVCFATEGIYLARLEHLITGAAHLRLGETVGKIGVNEWEYMVFFNVVQNKPFVRLEKSEKKNPYCMLKAAYSNEGEKHGCLIHTYGEHLNYGASVVCDAILGDSDMREKLEDYFLNARVDDPEKFYYDFVEYFKKLGVEEKDIEMLRVDVSVDAQNKGYVLFERGKLRKISFFRGQAYWRLCRNGAWDYVEGNMAISWDYNEIKHRFVLKSKIDDTFSELRRIKPENISRIINEANQLIDEYFGFSLED